MPHERPTENAACQKRNQKLELEFAKTPGLPFKQNPSWVANVQPLASDELLQARARTSFHLHAPAKDQAYGFLCKSDIDDMFMMARAALKETQNGPLLSALKTLISKTTT